MTTPKRRGRAVPTGREYRAGGSAASGQTSHNCAWISNVLSPSDHLAPLIARGAFSTGSVRHADLYGSFSVKWFFVVAGFLFGAERPFLVPSPAIRFAERAERCQGTEMRAQLSGLPLSVACVFTAPPVQARGRL